MLTMPVEGLWDLHDRVRRACQVATEAGLLLRDERPAKLATDTKSSPSDVVTEMDRASEALIVARLLESHPDDGVVGEEGSQRDGFSGVTWVIDPLDGTVNYLFGIPLWGVSVGIEVQGVREVGVIATPVTDDVFVGIRGHGAWVIHGSTATRLRARPTPSLDQALVSTGFGYTPERRVAQARVLEAVIGRVRDIRRTGCATTDFTWLALGRVDAFFERGLQHWDYSAGLVIAEEAGCRTSVMSHPVNGNFTVCATPEIFDELRALLLDLGADSGP